MTHQEKIFVYDAPGKFAFYSDFKIIPVDGLINDFNYNEEVKKVGINNYLKNNKIRYLILPDTHSKPMNVSFARMDAIKDNDNFKIKCYTPIHKEYIGDILLDNYNIIMNVPNLLRTWQKGHDFVSLWEVKNNHY